MPDVSDVTAYSWPPLLAAIVLRLVRHWDTATAIDDSAETAVRFAHPSCMLDTVPSWPLHDIAIFNIECCMDTQGGSGGGACIAR